MHNAHFYSNVHITRLINKVTLYKEAINLFPPNNEYPIKTCLLAHYCTLGEFFYVIYTVNTIQCMTANAEWFFGSLSGAGVRRVKLLPLKAT